MVLSKEKDQPPIYAWIVRTVGIDDVSQETTRVIYHAPVMYDVTNVEEDQSSSAKLSGMEKQDNIPRHLFLAEAAENPSHWTQPRQPVR